MDHEETSDQTTYASQLNTVIWTMALWGYVNALVCAPYTAGLNESFPMLRAVKMLGVIGIW